MLSLEQRYLEHLLPRIESLEVVDLGCGTGRWLERLASRSPRSLTGIDASAEMLQVAKSKVSGDVRLLLADCESLPLHRASIDFILSSFVASYLDDLPAAAKQMRRILRPGGSILLTDVHPVTAAALNWRRGFTVDGKFVDIATRSLPIQEITRAFESLGLKARLIIEPQFGAPELSIFERAGKLDSFKASEGLPAIYILHLHLPHPRRASRHETVAEVRRKNTLNTITSANLALGPFETVGADVAISGQRISDIASRTHASRTNTHSSKCTLDLTGFLLLPGLINAHDHLEFALFPRMGKGGYKNFLEWADDIYHPESSPVREHRAVRKETRLWWGAIRNLLCGVTTVCHHNPFDPEIFNDDFPVRVLRDFSWAHSLPIDPDAAAKKISADARHPFIIHLAEGLDANCAAELSRLTEAKALDANTVIVHGLALDRRSLAKLNTAKAALIWCPTSNVFLFGRTHSRDAIASLRRVALASDSPLTAQGDLLDEINHVATNVGLAPGDIYPLVTTQPANVLRLKHGEGTLRIGSHADFVAVRDTGASPANRLASLTYRDIELVIIAGRVQLASPSLAGRLPRSAKLGLHALDVEGEIRWIRAPIRRLFSEARKHLPGEIQLGGRTVRHVRSH
jgi:cytosine/adenosine deaminase-related metal-dependent hydrolase/ubiquinone/menaquinone biosynthesis C-methylase UbiE